MASPTPLRLTERDQELLAFAAEHRFVLPGQLARRFQITPAAAARRLRRLRAAGLLASDRNLREDPAAWSVTPRGLAAAGSDLSPPRPLDLATYRHDVGVAWLAAAAHDGVFGELSAVVGERRMRSEDHRRDRPPGTPRHGVKLGIGGSAGPGLHYPDLVLETASGHRVAFELELSTKSPARRERILAAYASDRRIDSVVYLVPDRAAAAAIERSAARVGAGEKLRVQRFRWAGGRAPGAGERARTAIRAGAARSAVNPGAAPAGPVRAARAPGAER